MTKALVLVLAALAIPGAALAAKPANTGGKGAPNVAYILKGTLSAYTAYDATTQTNGSITIVVAHANHHGKGLVGQTLTFPVDANTRISLNDGVSAIADNDSGIVKIRAAKKIAAADLAATLQTASARQIVDQGPTS